MSIMTAAKSDIPYAEVIGDPISQSKSPIIHGFWLEKLGIEAAYQQCHVRPDLLPQYFDMRRSDPLWQGCNVTFPHKVATLEWADELDKKAQSVGAANTVYRDDNVFRATNTDVDGVLESINAAQEHDQKKISIIGAGGAARAAFQAFAELGCNNVVIISRRLNVAASVVGEFDIKADIVSFDRAEEALKGSSLLINASPMGMAGQPAMPQAVLNAVSQMDEQALVFDMVYAPLQTELLIMAERENLKPVDGLHMLIGQAATAFEKFFGSPAPRAHDLELRKILTS